MQQLTDRQKLADFSADTGLPKIYLRAHESLIKYGIVNGGASVLISRFRVTETKGSFRFTAHGKLLRTWSRNSHGAWIEEDPMMIWDDAFEPFTVGKYDGIDPVEYMRKRAWERECARPGNERFPLLAPSHVLSTDDDRIKKHWEL